MLVVSEKVIAFVGYCSPHDLLVVLAPARNPVDPQQGVSLDGALLFRGRDGDRMLPLAAQFSDENAPAQIRLRDTLTQRLTAPEGVFARQYVPPEQRGIGDYETVKEGNLLRLVLMQKIFTGQAADALRPREMRPLDPRHFDITSNGVWLRVTSKPRAVRLIGEIGREYRQVMCVTTVDDDNNSAEFFMGPATGGVAVRRMVRRVRYSAPNLESLRLDMEELGPDAYTNDLYTRPAREYREALPRRLRRGLPDSGLITFCAGGKARLLSVACVRGIEQRDGEIRFSKLGVERD